MTSDVPPLSSPGPDGQPVRLRAEEPADLPFLFALYAATREPELAATRWSAAQCTAFLRQQFAALTAGYAATYPDADRWILESGGTSVGAVIRSRSAEEHRVVYLALAPAHRGRGLGGALLRHLQQEAAEARVPLRLQAFVDSPALRLYRRLGFVETGTDGLRIGFEYPVPTPSARGKSSTEPDAGSPPSPH